MMGEVDLEQGKANQNYDPQLFRNQASLNHSRM